MVGDETVHPESENPEEIEQILDESRWENQENLNTSADICYRNLYIRDLIAGSGLKLLQKDRVIRAYQQNGVGGLFKLFFTRSFVDKMRKWTNKSLEDNGFRTVNEAKFFAYFGLELGSSLIQYNDLDEYWKNNMFQGHADFKRVMSRDDFLRIRGHLKLRPPAYSHDGAIHDPLWHSRSLMEYFLKQIATIAVPIGNAALDENTVRTTARTKAKSYIANKPQPYGIRFYAVVGSKFTYLHSMFDNGSGNTTGISRAQAYVSAFRELRTPYEKQFGQSSCAVDKNSPSALWILQLAHQVKCDDASCAKRVIFTDNFYTRHNLAKELYDITDGKMFLIGTVKFTNVDAINRIYLSKAIQSMKDKPRGYWMVVRAFNKTKEVEALRIRHLTAMRNVSVNEKVPFEPPETVVAKHAGYILWKDSKLVMFYSNDLKLTPAAPMLEGNDPRAIECVHGLERLERWTGTESFHRTTFEVPAVIVAYNLFMNSVDRMDQRRSTNPTRRVEKRLYMSLFTLYLDLAVHNSFALLQEIDSAKASNTPYREFKRQISENLVSPWLNELAEKQKKKEGNNAASRSSVALDRNVLGSTTGTIHMLLENKQKLDQNCFLCMLRWKVDPETNEKWTPKLRTIYGCCECKKGFHVNCFTAYHYQGVLKGDTRALMDVIRTTSSEKPMHGMSKRCQKVASISDLRLKTPTELYAKFEKKKRRTGENN